MPNFVDEPGRSLPVVTDCDVLVAGGGPAGVAAAIAAARGGARVTLIETHGCLGGVWTAGLLSLILDTHNKSGLLSEILQRCRDRKALGPWGGQVYDPEAMKALLEAMCLESGVRLRLHTRVCAALQNENRQLSHVITESKSGREAWQARVFIDATGDGDLAAQAGCAFEVGRPEDGQTQPMSLMALVTGLDYAAVQPYVHDFAKPYGTDQKALVALLQAQGVAPSYSMPTLLQIHEQLFALMTNHQYGVSALNADDVTQATLAARAEINTVIATLQSLGGAWAQIKLVATGAQIGVREGRRIAGLYHITRDDICSGARFPDGICRVEFPVDVHAVDPRKDKGFSDGGARSQPYDIPLRALIAQGVDNLLLAGRCISGDFWAHASYRVTGNAVPMGEAAGRCAAHCARHKQTPHGIAADLETLSAVVQSWH